MISREPLRTLWNAAAVPGNDFSEVAGSRWGQAWKVENCEKSGGIRAGLSRNRALGNHEIVIVALIAHEH